MPWRYYPFNKKDKRKDGSIAICKTRQRMWIKSNRPYKPQKRGLEKPSLYSKRFGFLDMYNRKEQQQLKCPSGYSISQCFHVLGLTWAGYHRARLNEKNIKQMEKYAKAIQGIQKDMGIPTTSFPHLGLYGDVFVLNNKKGERVVFEDHSELKERQERYEKWKKEQDENAKKIQEKLQRPDKEKGEAIEQFADDVSPHEMVDAEEDEIVPDMLEPEEEKGEEEVVMTDEVPFHNIYKRDSESQAETEDS